MQPADVSDASIHKDRSSVGSNLTIDGALVSDRLVAMRSQEVVSYGCADYFRHLRVGRPFHASSSTSHPDDLDQVSPIEQRREKVCEWIFQVVDQCDMDREIAEVAMSFLDRFLASIVVDQANNQLAQMRRAPSSSTGIAGSGDPEDLRSLSPYPSQQQNIKRQKLQKEADCGAISPGSVACSDDEYSSCNAKSSGRSVSTTSSTSGDATIDVGGFAFQLASLTALYMAIKLYDHRRILIDRLAHLSRGNFCTDDIATMERTMLSALRWKCNPPTTISYLQTFRTLFPTSCPGSQSVNDDIIELARFFVELSVWECTFVSQDSSTIALAAIFNAMDMIGDTRFPVVSRQAFLENVEACAPGLFDIKGQPLAFVRHRLAEIFHHSAECTPEGVHEKFLSGLSVSLPTTANKDAREAIPSPVCISQFAT